MKNSTNNLQFSPSFPHARHLHGCTIFDETIFESPNQVTNKRRHRIDACNWGMGSPGQKGWRKNSMKRRRRPKQFRWANQEAENVRQQIWTFNFEPRENWKRKQRKFKEKRKKNNESFNILREFNEVNIEPFPHTETHTHTGNKNGFPDSQPRPTTLLYTAIHHLTSVFIVHLLSSWLKKSIVYNHFHLYCICCVLPFTCSTSLHTTILVLFRYPQQTSDYFCGPSQSINQVESVKRNVFLVTHISQPNRGNYFINYYRSTPISQKSNCRFSLSRIDTYPLPIPDMTFSRIGADTRSKFHIEIAIRETCAEADALRGVCVCVWQLHRVVLRKIN